MLRGKSQYINPAQAPEAGYNAPASQISILAGAQGINLSIAAGLSSACEALRLGTDEVRAGRTRAVVVGGVDVLSIVFADVQARRSSNASGTSFQQRRAGLRLSEAAACLLIERPSDAKRRGASIAALVKACDVRFCPTCVTGMIDDVEALLRDCVTAAGLQPSRIDAIFASANGDPETDLVEAEAIHRVFGSDTPVCGVKGAIGECLGASGAVLLVAAVLSLRKKTIPPTVGPIGRDPRLPQLNVSGSRLDRDLKNVVIVLVDAQGFAGCVVLSDTAGALDGGVS